MAVRASFLWRQFSRGWTENWYMDVVSVAAAQGHFSATDPDLQAMVNQRAAGTVLDAVRLSEVGGLRRSVIKKLRMQPASADDGDQADVVSTTALLQITSGSAQRKLAMRGLRDEDVNRNLFTGTDEPSGDLLAGIDAYRAFILGNTAKAFAIRKLEDIESNPWVPVYSLGHDTVHDRMIVVTPTTLDVQVGQYLYFRGLSNCYFPTLRGQHRVLSVTPGANQVIIDLGWTSEQATLTPINIAVRGAHYVYDRITGIEFDSFSSRNTGRPIGVPRGRSSGHKACRPLIPVVGA